MYNIAKVAKGEILLFFNDIFDALCKVCLCFLEDTGADDPQLAADSELSVKNGAELLDRLVKDVVSESAASYVSVLDITEKTGDDANSNPSTTDLPMAFSLARFIPLLEERIHVINPFTRTFLVSWLTLLDTIPDLELVYYLPAFLGGLFKFLGDPNRDVYVATQGLLERFLNEIKKIAKIKRGIAESRRSRVGRSKRPESQAESATAADTASEENAIADSESAAAQDEPEDEADGDWIPGQDVTVDHAKILDILLKFVDVSSNRNTDPTFRIEGLLKQKEEEIGIVALRWIDSFFEVSPEDILQFVPRILSQVLPSLSAQSDQVRTTASRVNRSLMDYIMTLQGEPDESPMPPPPKIPQRKQSVDPAASISDIDGTNDPQELSSRSSIPSPIPPMDLDYAASVNSLTLQFLNEHEETRVAALSWLIMLHRKAPKKVLAFNDGTFPALLKTLSDPAETVVTRDLQLLSQISKNSEDGYFASFMIALLQLFSTDRKLLEIRGNLIIRQLCINLQPERIYRTLAEIIEKDEDIEFASIMVQNLNNNLITAPELAELRKRLRTLSSDHPNKDKSSSDGHGQSQMFFVSLFRAWCYNAVATFSLCLLAQAYEQAYHLLQIFADLEMTVNMLIQIDKLVQLLESPVFTCTSPFPYSSLPSLSLPTSQPSTLPSPILTTPDLRLQLLEPDRYPYLYKCLYGLLMLLPQSSAFAALKNRLNSVSAIGLLHTPSNLPSSSSMSVGGGQRMSVAAGMGTAGSAGLSGAGTMGSGAGVPGRLNRSTREIGNASNPSSTSTTSSASSDVKWPELLEKFRQTQEKARRRNERLLRGQNNENEGGYDGAADNVGAARRSLLELHIDTQSQHHPHSHSSHHARHGSSAGLSNPQGQGQLGLNIGSNLRSSRNVDDRPPASAGLRSSRPGSGLGKPLPSRPDSALSQGRGSLDTARPGANEYAGGGRSGSQLGTSVERGGNGGGTYSSGFRGGELGAAGDKGHKSRHSLAGLGKFASGVGIGRVSSKDRERERERERERKEREGKK